MKAESKRSVRIMLQWLLSAATVLMAALLIWQCVTIYHEGIAPENMGENGLRIHDIYSREIVMAHFASIAWSVWVFLALLAANIVAGKPEQKDSHAGGESAADAARADGGDGRNPQSEETAHGRMVRRGDFVLDLRGDGRAIPAGLVEFCLA